jgi:hypothetical protein
LRQVSLVRTAKTRQLLKMAENAGRLLIILKRISSLPTFHHFHHLSAIFNTFSHFQQFQPFSAFCLS